MSTAAISVEALRLCLWLALLAAIFTPLERLWAVRAASGRRPDLAADIAFYFASALLPGLLLAAPLAMLATVGRHLLPQDYLHAMSALPFGVRAGLGFVIGEVGFYWGHRWSHQIPLLWRFHAVHHSPKQMDWLVNSRSHPVDLVFVRLCGMCPIYLLGLSAGNPGQGGLIAAFVVIAGTFWGFFLHANVRWRFGVLEWVIATPAFHHWHHVRDGPINRNYASTLPVLDRLFGTHHSSSSWPMRYGISYPTDTDREA